MTHLNIAAAYQSINYNQSNENSKPKVLVNEPATADSQPVIFVQSKKTAEPRSLKPSERLKVTASPRPNPPPVTLLPSLMDNYTTNNNISSIYIPPTLNVSKVMNPNDL